MEILVNWDTTYGLNLYGIIRSSIVAIENPIVAFVVDSAHKDFPSFMSRGNRAMERIVENQGKGIVDVFRQFICFRGRLFIQDDPMDDNVEEPTAKRNLSLLFKSHGRMEMVVHQMLGFRVHNESSDVWNADALEAVEDLDSAVSPEGMVLQQTSSSSTAVAQSSESDEHQLKSSSTATREHVRLRNSRVSQIHDIDFDHLMSCNALNEWTAVDNGRRDKTKRQLDQSRDYTIHMRNENGRRNFEIRGLKYAIPPKPSKPGTAGIEIFETGNPFNVLLASNLHAVDDKLDASQVTQMFVNVIQQAEKTSSSFSLKSSITSGLKMQASVSDSRDYHVDAKKSTNIKATLANQKRAVAFDEASIANDGSGGENIMKEYDGQHLVHSIVEYLAACCLRFMDVSGKVIGILESADAEKFDEKCLDVVGENQSTTHNEVCLNAINASLL